MRCEGRFGLYPERLLVIVIAEFPRKTQPPCAIELVPEDLTVTPLARPVGWKLVFKEQLPGALEITFWTTALERGLPCIKRVSSQTS